MDIDDAIQQGDIEAVRSLIALGIPERRPHPRHWFAAIAPGNVEMVRLFLQSGVDPRQGPERKPAHMAAEKGHRDILRLLIDAGADVNALDGEGQTPLEVGAQFDESAFRDEIVQMLLDAGTIRTYPVAVLSGDLASVRDWGDREPALLDNPWWLMMACRCGRLEVVRELVNRGVDPSVTLPNRNHALWFACNKHRPGRVPIAEFLVARGVDVNQVGENDETPLHQAAAWGNTDMVRYLIAVGANVKARASDGSMPLDYATHCGRDETAAAIGEKG